jgi:putative transposase
MKKSKFTEAQIVSAIKQAETGVSVAEVCRKMGVSEATFYNWKKKYGGLGVSELRKLRQLEEENRHLKQLVADLSIRLVCLPSSNPELDPIERLWRDMKDKADFHNFKDEHELEAWITNTINSHSEEQMTSLTGYGYIIDAVKQAAHAMEAT